MNIEQEVKVDIPWEKIEPLLGDWAPRFKPFWEKGGFNRIYSVLKTLTSNGKSVCPQPKNVFNAFKQCPISSLKTVFFGLSPYPHIIDGVTVSDGLTFSCANTGREQPSLKLIWNAVQDDVFSGHDISTYRNPSLQPWANQGVLLLNAALTCEMGRPESHIELWKPFMRFLFEEILSGISGVVFVFFGKTASLYSKMCTPFIHYIKIVEHPAFSARQDREFNHEKLFSYINNILRGNNGPLAQIDWIKIDDLPF